MTAPLLWLAAGIVAGGLYFAGLRATVRRLTRAPGDAGDRWGAGALILSAALRMALLLGLLGLAFLSAPAAGAAAFAGFIVARFVTIVLARRGAGAAGG